MSNNAIDYTICARRDYKNCIYLEQALFEDFAIYGVMFHIEQAIEKELIALNLLSGGNEPHIADIDLQFYKDDCIKRSVVLPEELDDDLINTLTAWVEASRYPSFPMRFSRSDYEKAKRIYYYLDNLFSELTAD